MDSSTPTLTLRITRHDGQPAAPDGGVKVFGERGGTIGRAPQNDWVLADPSRTLSAHHATVYFDQGRFHLVDCSSNGVFLNDAPQPLGIETIGTLAEGDRLRLGTYHVLVSLASAPRGRLDPLRLLETATRGTAGMPDAKTAGPRPGTPCQRWSDFGGPHAGPADDGDPRAHIVDPLALLGGAARRPGPGPEPASERNDAPLLASHFRPPDALVPAVLEDWLEPAAPGRHEAAGAAVAHDPAQALEIASAALRDALAAIESLRSRHAPARASASTLEVQDGLA